jgi:hypothetical protein
VFTPLLFPTGRLLSPRWRPVAWLAGVTTAVLTTLTSLQTELEVAPGQVVPNPIGVAAVGNPQESPAEPAVIILLVVLAAAFGSLVVRFRRSRGEERQQLKWFTYAAALLPLATAPAGVLPAPLDNLVFAVPTVFLPVASGIAILRYRLYDIDRLINRTLVYGLLTVLLGAIYVGLVLVLGQLSGALGTEPPSWVVAGATLAVAALFQPARRRIQTVVDRRFNRRKYNAAKTMEAFSLRLRDEVDLDALSAELLAVVDQTVQPTRASLWLRPSDKRPLRTGTYIAHAVCLPVRSLGLHQAFKLGGRQIVDPSCTRSSRGVVARPVSNLVSIGVPVPSGRGRLRRSGPPRPGTDRPAGHGKADTSLDHLHAMQFRPAPLPLVRGEQSAQRSFWSDVTDRWIPLVTAACGMRWHGRRERCGSHLSEKASRSRVG